MVVMSTSIWHFLHTIIRDILNVVTGDPQGGIIPGFPLMFHMPYGLERPVPVRVFLACTLIIPAAVGILKCIDTLLERRKKHSG